VSAAHLGNVFVAIRSFAVLTGLLITLVLHVKACFPVRGYDGAVYSDIRFFHTFLNTLYSNFAGREEKDAGEV
jgi:hypothetical protein